METLALLKYKQTCAIHLYTYGEPRAQAISHPLCNSNPFSSYTHALTFYNMSFMMGVGSYIL